jgi:hypothetical protein
LMGRRYSVCWVFHKRGKVIHNAHSFTRRVNDGDDLLAGTVNRQRNPPQRGWLDWPNAREVGLSVACPDTARVVG